MSKEGIDFPSIVWYKYLMKKMKLEISYKNGFIHIVEKGANMGAYDNLDPNFQVDQKYILREIGKVKANMMEQSPSSLASDMGMPKSVIDWLDEVFAHFVIEVRVDCE